MADILDRLAGPPSVLAMRDAADQIRQLRRALDAVSARDEEFNAALRNLVAAHRAREASAGAISAIGEPPAEWAELPAEQVIETDWHKAHLAFELAQVRLANVGSRVAVMAIQRGVEPTEEA